MDQPTREATIRKLIAEGKLPGHSIPINSGSLSGPCSVCREFDAGKTVFKDWNMSLCKACVKVWHAAVAK